MVGSGDCYDSGQMIMPLTVMNNRYRICSNHTKNNARCIFFVLPVDFSADFCYNVLNVRCLAVGK